MGTANNQRIMPLVDEAQIPYVAPAVPCRCARPSTVRSSTCAPAIRMKQRLSASTQKPVSMGITDLAIVYGTRRSAASFWPMPLPPSRPQARLLAPRASARCRGRTVGRGRTGRCRQTHGSAAGHCWRCDGLLVNEFKEGVAQHPTGATSVALSGDNLRQLGGKTAGLALSMVLLTQAAPAWPWFANTRRPCAPPDSRNFSPQL